MNTTLNTTLNNNASNDNNDDKEVLCNKCGGSCIPKGCREVSKNPDAYGLIDAQVEGGYFSKDLEDTWFYKFSLCEKCLKELFDSCKIPPEMENFFYSGVKPQKWGQ